MLTCRAHPLNAVADACMLLCAVQLYLVALRLVPQHKGFDQAGWLPRMVYPAALVFCKQVSPTALAVLRVQLLSCCHLSAKANVPHHDCLPQSCMLVAVLSRCCQVDMPGLAQQLL